MKIKVKYDGPQGFTFTPEGGALTASQAKDAYSQFHKDWGKRLAAESTHENHKLYAFNIIEPIDKVREYVEWTQLFFHEETEDFNNPTLFADDDEYTAVAWTISPDGGPTMLRPGTPVYSGISPQRIDTGLEFNVDQLRRSGWDVQGRKVKEAGNELGRKRNAMRYSLMDAAVPGAHTYSSYNGILDYPVLREIMVDTANSFYKPSFLVMNPSRLWDIGQWADISSTTMWKPGPELSEDVLFRNGHFSNLFGINWFAYDTVPEDEIWLGSEQGQDYDFIYMPLEAAIQDFPLDRRTMYRWLEDRTSYLRDADRYWKIEIEAGAAP